METILKTNLLTKQFKKQKAVDGVSLQIERGAIYGLIGRNGAGKTTFLRMVAGLARPTSGEIELMGIPSTEKSIRSAFERVGCLIEQPGIYNNLSAFENCKLKAMCCGVYSKEYVEEKLALVGLSDVGKKTVGNFSLGMKQRLGIALAMIGEPDLLILDEPINGLDPQGIIEVRDIIQTINRERNITILISSHILEELSKIATHYGIIHNGRLEIIKLVFFWSHNAYLLLFKIVRINSFYFIHLFGTYTNVVFNHIPGKFLAIYENYLFVQLLDILFGLFTI